MTQVQTSSLRGEALKNKVLETALTLFSEQGYFNSSIHDIRRAAGVSTGAIYHHFKNKEALAKCLYETLLIEMNDAINLACLKRVGCLEKCQAIIERLFQLTTEKPKAMQFILLAQHREYLPEEPPICSSSPFQTMKQIITEGIAQGEVKKMDTWVAASAMFGSALRMMNLYLDGVLDAPLEEYSEAIVECAWRGIRA